MGPYSAVLWLSNIFSSENIHTFYLITPTLKLCVLVTFLVNIFVRYIPPNHYAMLFAINEKQAKLTFAILLCMALLIYNFLLTNKNDIWVITYPA